MDSQAPYWTLDASAALLRVNSTRRGLASTEAARRLATHGANTVRERRELSRLAVLGRQLVNPLLSLLLFAAAASAITGEFIDAAIVLSIVTVTVAIGYSREYSAHAAAAALRARLRLRCTALRDGQPQLVASEDIVPGDIVLLSAGSLIPADGVVLEATDFFVSEAVLTGESFPVQKRPGSSAAASELRDRVRRRPNSIAACGDSVTC